MRFLTTMLLVLTTSQIHADDFIVFVFDSSGSMGDKMSGGKTRMETAQEALIEVVSQVSDNTRVGVLTFNGWSYDLQKVNRSEMAKAVRSIKPSGATPLYECIREGATRLLQERDKQLDKGLYRLVIVTDGDAGDTSLNRKSNFRDGTVRPGVMDDIARRNIRVDAIGLDMKGNHAIKEIIESKNLGAYMQGNDPKTLKQSLLKAVAEISLNGQDTDEDAFAELSDLPDEFFTISVKGLTTNQNHPIGEKPPLVSVNESGELEIIPDPNGEKAPESSNGFGIVAIFGAIVSAIIVIVVIVKTNSER